MAENVRLDIVLSDDGQPATRPGLPPQNPAPSAGPGTPARPRLQSEAAPAEQPHRARLEGETPESVRQERPAAAQDTSWLSRFKEAGALLVGAAQRFEKFAVPLANNDYLTAFRAAATTAGEGLQKLGPYGQAAAAGLQAVAGVAESMGAVVTAFIDRGKQLQQYSPELAVSNARAELTSLFSDMKEAQELGPGLARMTDAQTELIAFLRDTFLPIKKWVIGNLAPAMEYVTATLQNLVIIGENVLKYLQPILDILGSIVSTILSALAQIMEFIDRQLGLAEARARKFGGSVGDTAGLLFERMIQDIIGRDFAAPGRIDPAGGL